MKKPTTPSEASTIKGTINVSQEVDLQLKMLEDPCKTFNNYCISFLLLPHVASALSLKIFLSITEAAHSSAEMEPARTAADQQLTTPNEKTFIFRY